MALEVLDCLHLGWVALPLFPFALPFLWIARLNPPIPFSLYARAVRPGAPP